MVENRFARRTSTVEKEIKKDRKEKEENSCAKKRRREREKRKCEHASVCSFINRRRRSDYLFSVGSL